MTFITSTSGSVATRRLGRMIGRHLSGGEIVELQGDIGSGKTTLVQGIVAGMGFRGEVPSPTFTLSRAYPVYHGLTLYHFDLYRLAGHDIVTDELDEVAGNPETVVVVEWAQSGAAKLPSERLCISLVPEANATEREFTVTGSGPAAARIMKGLRHDYHA